MREGGSKAKQVAMEKKWRAFAKLYVSCGPDVSLGRILLREYEMFLFGGRCLQSLVDIADIRDFV